MRVDIGALEKIVINSNVEKIAEHLAKIAQISEAGRGALLKGIVGLSIPLHLKEILHHAVRKTSPQ